MRFVPGGGRAALLALVLAGGCVLLPPPAPLPPLPPPEPAPAPVPPPEPQPAPAPAHPAPPPIAREFRGVWIASVGNLDWPSRAGLPVERQQAELVAMLDRVVELGLNAVIFQVRPGADALYASPYEPWSEYLTGRMGQAPEPFYDPLEFAVREAHRRGLELHAWFNPFRSRYSSRRGPASADHISRTHPNLVREYGPYGWLDPGEPEVQDHSLRVILDVVRRYDVDGVHIDDYFYPYREYTRGKLIEFPDAANYTRYRREGGGLSRSDWRRANVDRFVERLYTEIKREAPRVKVGISPFGIWRPGHPPQIRGLDAYEEIFADARKWLLNGWLDYLTPQLYWPIDQHAQSFPVLLDWWLDQNPYGRHLWPGSFDDRVGARSKSWPAEEILAQIEVTRQRPLATGNVHFRMTALLHDRDGLGERLATESYAQPALVPASYWLEGDTPEHPRVERLAAPAGRVVLAVQPEGVEEVFLWAVQSRTGGVWTTEIVPGWRREVEVAGGAQQVVVTPVGRTGNEGPAVSLMLDDASPVSR